MRSVLDAASAYGNELIRARTKAAPSSQKARASAPGTVRYGYTADASGRLVECPSSKPCSLRCAPSTRRDSLSARSSQSCKARGVPGPHRQAARADQVQDYPRGVTGRIVDPPRFDGLVQTRRPRGRASRTHQPGGRATPPHGDQCPTTRPRIRRIRAHRATPHRGATRGARRRSSAPTADNPDVYVGRNNVLRGLVRRALVLGRPPPRYTARRLVEAPAPTHCPACPRPRASWALRRYAPHVEALRATMSTKELCGRGFMACRTTRSRRSNAAGPWHPRRSSGSCLVPVEGSSVARCAMTFTASRDALRAPYAVRCTGTSSGGERRLVVRGQRPLSARVRCPWHDERTGSCSRERRPDGTIRVRCFGCRASGDVLSLVAAVHGLDVRRDFVRVLGPTTIAGVAAPTAALPLDGARARRAEGRGGTGRGARPRCGSRRGRPTCSVTCPGARAQSAMGYLRARRIEHTPAAGGSRSPDDLQRLDDAPTRIVDHCGRRGVARSGMAAIRDFSPRWAGRLIGAVEARTEPWIPRGLSGEPRGAETYMGRGRRAVPWGCADLQARGAGHGPWPWSRANA